MIGSVKECEGLYYFDEANVSRQCPPTVCNSTSSPGESELLLWHKRMGHPSFQYLQHLFPSLCSNKASWDFQCEVCELAKHHRAFFLNLSINHPYHLLRFIVIYGDPHVPLIGPIKNGILLLLRITLACIGYIC